MTLKTATKNKVISWNRT